MIDGHEMRFLIYGDMRKLPIAWHLHLLSGVTLIGVVMFLCERAQTPNAIIKRKSQTLPANATSNGGFYHTTTTYTPSILHLTQTRCNSLTINALLSVRYYKFYLHATYTPYILPHGTNTRGRCHGIVKQKRLLLRQIVLRPYGV